MINIVAVSGSLSSASRTRALAESIMSRIAHHKSARQHVIDIAELAPDLGKAISFNHIPPSIMQAQKILSKADLIILASPVYKGSYSGLFKHFLDLLAPDAIRGKVVILAATGGSERHALILEHQLRPLASFFEAVTVPAGVYAKDTEFTGYALPDDRNVEILKRIDIAASQALTLLPLEQSEALAA
jgi:FMN reductase